jgi:hypothetical protein
MNRGLLAPPWQLLTAFAAPVFHIYRFYLLGLKTVYCLARLCGPNTVHLLLRRRRVGMGSPFPCHLSGTTPNRQTVAHHAQCGKNYTPAGQYQNLGWLGTSLNGCVRDPGQAVG